MELATNIDFTSWKMDDSPLVLPKICSDNCSIAIWQRPSVEQISSYFELAFKKLGLGLREVFSMQDLKSGLNRQLPSLMHKEFVIEDIYLLSDMLTCLFGCSHVGVRITPLSKAMCPRFHTDNVPVRLVSTYLGGGTEWLARESLTNSTTENTDLNPEQYLDQYYSPEHIQKLSSFDVALLKGSAWPGQANMGAIHRSSAASSENNRVLLSLDPM